MPSPFSPESEQRDFRMHALLSPESEDESGKHPLYSTGPKSDFCMNAPFPRASTRFWNARNTLPIPRAAAGLQHAHITLPVPRAAAGLWHAHITIPIPRAAAGLWDALITLSIPRMGASLWHAGHTPSIAHYPRGEAFSNRELIQSTQ